MAGTPRSECVSTQLQQIAKLAGEDPERALTSLSHRIDVSFLREAYARTRKGGAVGVDGQGARDYEADLERNLEDLHARFKSGSYRAPPVRRVHIPKGGGRTRPIGIPTFEDKVLQRGVSMALEAVYEQDFLDCSYGFRPGRSAHQAIQRLWNGVMDMGGGWVLDADIKSFFDDLDHGHLRTFLDKRIRDGVLRRSIDKWLKAGILEAGELRRPEGGTPQGGVISPLLANIYLHEVLDRWFAEEVQPRMRGACFMVRYADDFVMVFAQEADARRVFDVLGKRLGRFGLTLHPEKTQLINFRPPHDGGSTDEGRPGTFALLGFLHFWGKSRKGAWVVKRKTAKDRYTRGLKAVGLWLKRYRHLPVAEQHATLTRKLRGHYAYYGITGNSWSLANFRYHVGCLWRKWLERRSQRGRMTWARFNALLRRFPLPPPLAVHSIYRRGAKP